MRALGRWQLVKCSLSPGVPRQSSECCWVQLAGPPEQGRMGWQQGHQLLHSPSALENPGLQLMGSYRSYRRGLGGWRTKGMESSLFCCSSVATLPASSHSCGVPTCEHSCGRERVAQDLNSSDFWADISCVKPLNHPEKGKFVSCFFIPLWLRPLTINVSDSCVFSKRMLMPTS